MDVVAAKEQGATVVGQVLQRVAPVLVGDGSPVGGFNGRVAGEDRAQESVNDYDRALAFDGGELRFVLQMARWGALRLAEHRHRKLSLSHSGRHEEAIAEADSLAGIEGVTGGGLYNCACVYARASAAASDAETREKRAAGALALLRRAQAVGHFKIKSNLEELKTDPDLDALRARKDFQKLLAEIDGAQP